MRTRRIILSFFLLALLTAPVLSLLFLQLKQAYIKHTLEERLETQLLKTLIIPKQEWQEPDADEIVIDGKMFDIKERRETASGVMVTGVFDEDETAVLHRLAAGCNEQSAKDVSLFAHAFQLLHGFFFQSGDASGITAVATGNVFQNLIVRLPVSYKQVLYPPPQQTPALLF